MYGKSLPNITAMSFFTIISEILFKNLLIGPVN
jgi:hypothetical protein